MIHRSDKDSSRKTRPRLNDKQVRAIAANHAQVLSIILTPFTTGVDSASPPVVQYSITSSVVVFKITVTMDQKKVLIGFKGKHIKPIQDLMTQYGRLNYLKYLVEVVSHEDEYYDDDDDDDVECEDTDDEGDEE